MARNVAVVAAFLLDCARLSTDIVWLLADAQVTVLDALVEPTLDLFTAWKSAAERFLTARDCLSRFMLAIAGLCREMHALRTLRLAVAEMVHWMVAAMSSCAFVLAFRNNRAARNRRINNNFTTLAPHFVEGSSLAWIAVSNVARSSAAMLFAL